jgi:EpsI family protein
MKVGKLKAVVSFTCLFLAWAFFFWPTLVSIFAIKKSIFITLSTYGIIAVSVAFIIAKRKAIETSIFMSSQLGLVGLLLMVVFFILGQITQIHYAQQSAVILMFPTLVMIAFGPLLVQTILFPLLYLMFIIPLQDTMLDNPALIVGAAILVLATYLGYQKFSVRKTAGFEGFSEKTPLWISTNARWFMPTFLAFSLLMVSPWLGDNIRAFYPLKHKEIALRAPLGTQGWVGPYSVTGQAWSPVYPNASATLQKEYFNDVDAKNSVYLYTAYFDSDRNFSDMLDEANTLYDSKLWKQVAVDSRAIKLNNNETVNVYQATLESAGVSRVVWYWYYVTGVSTTDLSWARLLDKVRIIAKYAQGSGLVAISTTYTTNSTEATDRLKAFLNTMHNGLDALKRPEIFYK